MSLKVTLSALMTLLVSISAALGVPTHTISSLSLDTINNTNVFPQAPQHVQNLTFSQWPELPYKIPLYSRSGIPELSINYVLPSRRRRPPVDVKGFQDFVIEFRDNLAEEYPGPGYAPSYAGDSHIDLDSDTKWTIDFEEGWFGRRLPIEWGLLGLNELSRQLGVHGPASIYFTIVEDKSTYMTGFLLIRPFGRLSLKASLADGETNFQTS